MNKIARDFSASVRQIEYVGRRYAVVEVQCSPDFIHSPGQFTKVTFVDDNGSFDRYYSIASASHGDGRFELCLLLDDQRIRDLLADWTVGTTFLCSAPSGRFFVPPLHKSIVCIAGGSGITPLKAIIEDRVQSQASARTVLLYGCQSDSEIPFYEELETLKRQTTLLDLQFFCVENALGRAQVGRPLDHLQRYVWPDADYLLCGPPALMEAARQQLEQQGIAPEAIHQDRY